MKKANFEKKNQQMKNYLACKSKVDKRTSTLVVIPKVTTELRNTILNKHVTVDFKDILGSMSDKYDTVFAVLSISSSLNLCLY